MSSYTMPPDVASVIRDLQKQVANLARKTQQFGVPMVLAAQTDTQTVNGGADIAFDDIVLDSDLMVTSPSVLTVRTPGQWLFVVGMQWGVSPGADNAHSVFITEVGSPGPVVGAQSSVYHPKTDGQCACSLRLTEGMELKFVAAASVAIPLTTIRATLTAQWLSP